MKQKLLYPFLSLIFFNTINAQQKIQFRLTKNNNIIVKTLVNKKDSLDLMFQIATDDGSISPNRKHEITSLTFDKNEISDGNSISIGNLEWKDMRFFNNELSGHESDGKLGTSVFEGKAFTIDYDKNEFQIFEKNPSTKGYAELPLKIKNGQFFITAKSLIDGKEYESEFLLQSGYSGGILFSNDFADKNNLNEHLKSTSEKTLKNSQGQSVTTKQAVLAQLKIGKYKLRNIAAGYFTGELKMQHNSYFAADVMKRFNWIFDVKREKVYVKPSKYFKDAYLKI